MTQSKGEISAACLPSPMSFFLAYKHFMSHIVYCTGDRNTKVVSIADVLKTVTTLVVSEKEDPEFESSSPKAALMAGSKRSYTYNPTRANKHERAWEFQPMDEEESDCVSRVHGCDACRPVSP